MAETYLKTLVNVLRSKSVVVRKRGGVYDAYFPYPVAIVVTSRYVGLQTDDVFKIPRRLVRTIIVLDANTLLYTRSQRGTSSITVLQEPCKASMFIDEQQIVIRASRYKPRRRTKA